MLVVLTWRQQNSIMSNPWQMSVKKYHPYCFSFVSEVIIEMVYVSCHLIVVQCSTLQAEEVKNVDAGESAGQIFGDAAENGSHQFKEENRIVEKNRTNTCDGVGRGCPKKRKKTRQKQSANVCASISLSLSLPPLLI